MTRNLTLLAALSLCLSLCVAHSSPLFGASIYLDQLYGVSVTSNIEYTQAKVQPSAAFPTGLQSLKLDVYQPVDIGNAPMLHNRPAIVIQDGGAWVSASKTNGRVVTPAMYCASLGYTVFVTDYRQGASNIAGNGGNVVPIVGQTQFGTQPYSGISIPFIYQVFPGTAAIRSGVEDFAVAMDWVRTHAASYDINPNLLCATGGSAGGIDNLLLQYNNDPVNSAYRAQAVIALVSTMYTNWNRINPGGPPVFLLNNPQDPLITYSPDVPNMINRFNQAGIYNEPWQQDPNPTNHDVKYDFHPYIPAGGPIGSNGSDISQSEDLLERMRDFLAYHFSGGPILVVPEPSSVVLAVTAFVGLAVVGLRRSGAAHHKNAA